MLCDLLHIYIPEFEATI